MGLPEISRAVLTGIITENYSIQRIRAPMSDVLCWRCHRLHDSLTDLVFGWIAVHQGWVGGREPILFILVEVDGRVSHGARGDDIGDDSNDLLQIVELASPRYSLWTERHGSLMIYSKISNIRRTKSQNLNDSHLVLKSSLYNPLKPGVKSRMKM